MNVAAELDSLLSDARCALAVQQTDDRSVAGLVDRVATLGYCEGALVGFLDTLVVTDPLAARLLAPKIEAFVSEAIAARILHGKYRVRTWLRANLPAALSRFFPKGRQPWLWKSRVVQVG